MPRRAAAQVRRIEPDAIHRSRLVQQVINKVMLDGKKSTAERIVYDALAILGERSGKEPVESLEQSIKALTPVLEVRSRRVGGATYQVPVEVPAPRARTLAVRWLVEFARQRREKTMAQRLANELLDAQQQQGGAAAGFRRSGDEGGDDARAAGVVGILVGKHLEALLAGAFDRGAYSVELVSTADERNGCGIGHEVNLRVTTVSENPSSMPAAAKARLLRVLSRRTP